jgi:hypothetical protein
VRLRPDPLIQTKTPEFQIVGVNRRIAAEGQSVRPCRLGVTKILQIFFGQRLACLPNQLYKGSELPLRRSRRLVALEHITVLRDVRLPVGRDLLLCEDRRDRALGHARPAVDALVGLDVELVFAPRPQLSPAVPLIKMTAR